MKTMEDLTVNELEIVSGGTQAEIDELMEIINSKPELLRMYNEDAELYPRLSQGAHIDYVLFQAIGVACIADRKDSNIYLGDRFLSHEEVIEQLKNI